MPNPTNYGENPPIFCQNCGGSAQPPVQPTNRKRVILKEYDSEETFYLSLTDEQIGLLSWMIENVFDDAEYEVMDAIDFEVV